MKKSIREKKVKQSLNSLKWSRLIHALENDTECPLIVKHHNGIDSDDITLDCFGENLALLKSLREALQTATPAQFDEFFAFKNDFPRKIHQRTKLYRTLKSATDEELAAISPLFGGCLFVPCQQEEVFNFLNSSPREMPWERNNSPFLRFVHIFWLSAWKHAMKTPMLTGMVFGLSQELVETLRNTTASQILSLVYAELPFSFSIQMSESLLLNSVSYPRVPLVKVMQIGSLLASRGLLTKVLGFKE